MTSDEFLFITAPGSKLREVIRTKVYKFNTLTCVLQRNTKIWDAVIRLAC